MEFERVLLSLVRLFILLSTTESIEVVGGEVSIVQLKNAGEESRFITLSSALTSNTWDPSARSLNRTGLAQTSNGALSMEHSKWSIPEPLSVPENAKFMEVEDVLPPADTVFLFPSMAELIEVFG